MQAFDSFPKYLNRVFGALIGKVLFFDLHRFKVQQQVLGCSITNAIQTIISRKVPLYVKSTISILEILPQVIMEPIVDVFFAKYSPSAVFYPTILKIGLPLILLHPLETIKTAKDLSMDGYFSAGHFIYANSGIRGFYSGFFLSFVSLSFCQIFNSLVIQIFIKQAYPKSKLATFCSNFLCLSLSSLIIFPLDTIRHQMMMLAAQGVLVSPLTALRIILNMNGLSGLFSGFPILIFRVLLVSSFVNIFEESVSFLQRNLKKN